MWTALTSCVGNGLHEQAHNCTLKDRIASIHRYVPLSDALFICSREIDIYIGTILFNFGVQIGSPESHAANLKLASWPEPHAAPQLQRPCIVAIVGGWGTTLQPGP